MAAAAVAAFRQPHSGKNQIGFAFESVLHTVHCIELLGLRVCVAYIPNAGSEEEREEIGDDKGVDDLLRVRRPLLVAETRLPDGVEGPAGVVGAQLARRRRFSTSDNVGEFPLPAECKFRRYE